MKLLIVHTVPFLTNGITSVILNYYRNMDKEGLQTDFIANSEIELNYRQFLEKSGSKVYLLERNKNPFKYMSALFRILKKGRYDIIHIHGNSAMMFFDLFPAFLARTKVRIVHSHNTTCSHMKAHKILNPFFKHCYTHGFACGEAAGKWLFGNRPFTVLKNGIDLESYAFNGEIRNKYRQKLHAENFKVIGHAGNFNSQKNHSFLLDLFADLLNHDPNYILALFGEGEFMEPMKEKARLLGIDQKVIFWGKTNEMSSFMQAMDLFLLPSLFEGLPVTLVEAQAAGLPCLVSNTVSDQADLTETLKFLPIAETAPWVAAILDTKIQEDRSAQCKDYQEKIAKKGYDIKSSAQILKELYSNYCRK